MDFFNEHLIKKHKDSRDILKTIAIWVGVFACIYLLFLAYEYVRMIFFILIAGVIYVAFRLFTGLNVEYEYISTNTTLDVDKIIAQRKRKRLCSVDIRNIDYFAPVNEKYSANMKNPSITKTIDATAHNPNVQSYYALFNKDGQRVCLIIDANEKMLRNFENNITRSNFYTE